MTGYNWHFGQKEGNGTVETFTQITQRQHKLKQLRTAIQQFMEFQPPNNLKRVANVRPDNWQNPTPQSMYNMLVIGGGSAGSVTAIIAAGSAKVALIEKHMMGGDCLNVGCVPSKAVICSANIMGQSMKAKDFGITGSSGKVDFGEVMERVRRVLAELSPNDSVWRYKELGVDLPGEGRFTGRNQLQVAGAQIDF